MLLPSACGGTGKKSSAATTTTSSTTTTIATTTTVPPTGQVLLRLLVLQPSDAAPGYTVDLIPAGDKVTDRVTLDLCNGTFPSEDLRTDRRQVVLNKGEDSFLSAEAVLYKDPAGANQAADELVAAQRTCPNKFQPGLVQGEPPTKTTFRAAPDAAWAPPPAGIRRLAFDFDIRDQKGNAQRDVTVYLFRGKAMVAVYFDTPDKPQAPVNGQTSIDGIVALVQSRLAAVSSAAVGE